MMTSRKLFSILIAIAGLASCKGGTAEVEEPVAVREPSIYGFYPEDFRTDTVTVKSGEVFSKLTERLGMGARDSYELVQKCGEEFDVRKIIAGNKVYACYSTDSLSRLEYMIYVKDRIHSTVFKCSDSLAVWNVERPTTKERVFTDVTINSSLWNDMIASGASPTLIMDLADIYQWSVNFFALQKGDRFRMIYTQTLCEGEFVGIDTVHFSLFSGEGVKSVAAVLFDTGSGKKTYWDKGGESLKRMFLKAPLKYNRVSSTFSYHRKHPVTGKVKAHTAVDYAAPTGTPVHAIGDGTVTLCGWDGTGGGNRIRIKHMRGYESCYMHLSKFAPGIKVGSRVSQGQLIGYVGATGTATGPHLDFRIWENGKPIDPLKLNSPASEPLDKKYMEAFDKLYEQYMAQIDSLSNGN